MCYFRNNWTLNVLHEAKYTCHNGLIFFEVCLCLMELLVSLLQKRQPLPLSPQNYPLHGSEVNGFHSAPTTYNHTPTINGDGIMGKELDKMSLSYKCRLSVSSSPKNKLTGHLTHHLLCLCSQPRHHSWQFRRWNWEGSCLCKFFSVCCWEFFLLNWVGK